MKSEIYEQMIYRIGKEIKRRREEKGWSCKELADKMGYSYSHVRSVERGAGSPSLKFIFDACDVYGTKINSLLWFIYDY